MEGYHLPPVLFTEDEANALITVEQMALNNKDQSFSENVSSAVDNICIWVYAVFTFALSNLLKSFGVYRY